VDKSHFKTTMVQKMADNNQEQHIYSGKVACSLFCLNFI